MEEITGRGTFADERVEIYDMNGENGTLVQEEIEFNVAIWK